MENSSFLRLYPKFGEISLLTKTESFIYHLRFSMRKLPESSEKMLSKRMSIIDICTPRLATYLKQEKMMGLKITRQFRLW